MPFSKPKMIIAGPCSVETREQLYETTKQLVESSKVNILRAGVWKPRTSPSSFEGLGVPALSWLREIKKEFNIPVAIEVASPFQIEEALKHEIDILWLGARTTVSPFSVQEIANALKGVKASVLIKNPINPDIALWSGAVERISKAGVRDIALIHRGFCVLHHELRYPPLWHLALKMKERHKDIPMVCDPSHICGTREFIEEIAQYALALGMDGLMLESHYNPEKAWSDAKQQITPKNLALLLNSLKWPTSRPSFSEGNSFLSDREFEIDQLGFEIEKLTRRRESLLHEAKRIKLLP